MSTPSTNTEKRFKGGEYIVREQEASSIFIPEEFDEEQRMIADMARDFLATEVLPILDRIDAQEPGLMEKLLEKAGELGLLATSIPEKYDGFGKDFNTSLLLTEVVGAGHSFAVALAAHTGIGTLPILYFGTDEQKKKYLPKLASGEWKASYCLTEPGSGSDALAAKTKAVLSEDGTDKRCGLQTQVLQTPLLYLHKLMAISSQALLLKKAKALRLVTKNIKWVSKDLQPVRSSLTTAKYRKKMCWEKLAKDI